jgi:hypothetical protein
MLGAFLKKINDTLLGVRYLRWFVGTLLAGNSLLHVFLIEINVEIPNYFFIPYSFNSLTVGVEP